MYCNCCSLKKKMRIKDIKWNLRHQRKITAKEGERLMSKAQDFESIIEISCLILIPFHLESLWKNQNHTRILAGTEKVSAWRKQWERTSETKPFSDIMTSFLRKCVNIVLIEITAQFELEIQAPQSLSDLWFS